MSFKIADGYVEVHARHDKASTRRNAKEAADIAENEGRSREGSMLRWLFKSNPSLHNALVQPIAAIFSSPIIFTAAMLMAASVAGFLAAGITTALLTGIAVGFVGIGAYVHRKALAVPWKKATDDIKGVFERASMPIVQPLINAINMLSPAFKRMEPAFTRIYEALAPLIEPFTGGLLGFLEAMLPGIERSMPGIQTVVLALAEHLPGLGTAMGDFFATLSENGPMLERVVGLFITWLDIFFKVAGPIILELMREFVVMADTWNSVTDALNAATDWVQDTWTKIPGWWDTTWGAVSGWFSNLGRDIGGFFTGLWTTITDWWTNTGTSLSGWWDSTWGTVTTWFSELPGRIGGFFAAIPGAILGWIQFAFDTATYMIGYAIGTWVGLMLALPGRIVEAVTSGWSMVNGWVESALTWITDRWGEFQTWLFLNAAALPGRISNFFQDMFARIVLFVSAGLQAIFHFWDTLPTRLSNTAREAWNSVYGWFDRARTWLDNTSTNIRDRIVMAIAGLGVRMFNAGRDAIMGLVNGIGSLMGWAIDAAWNAAKNIARGFMDALRIGSPSKVMRDEVGKWIPKGIAVGIEDNMGDIDDIAARLPDTFTGAMGAGSTTTTDSSTNYGNIIVEVHVDNLQELADIQAFLDGNLRNSTKARNWSGNLYEAQGEYTRSYS